jgi:signal transduction histidine kinase
VGPFFYTAAQSRFLHSLNLMLGIAALLCMALMIVVSALLGTKLASPIREASAAAGSLARYYRDKQSKQAPSVDMKTRYKTRELAELAASINMLASELAASEERQKQLTSDISHELRTPVACLQGTLEGMIDGVFEPSPERLASCREETERLTRLIGDLRLLTDIEWDRVSLQKSDFAVDELLRSLAAEFEGSMKDKGLEIRVTATQGLTVNADYDRLKQVLVNLISNALKYTDKGSITLGAEKRGNGIVITVRDTGIGIPKEDLPHIFERFYRTDKSRNRGTGGSGIGLTIAAAIVKAHGWALDVQSQEGSGTVFTILTAVS